MHSHSLEDLRKKMYMPVINLKVIKLTQPVTVCTSSQCAEIYKVGDINKWHYKQKCHDPCYLTNVPKEIIGSPELVHCAAMNRSTGICQNCSCSFRVHMHIYYTTETVEDRIVDPSVQQNINNRERLMEKARILVKDISQKKTELEKEHEVIVKSCAKFAHFLQTNAITPFSDSYKEYIEYLIIREKSLGVLSNMEVVHHLEKLLREYEEAKKSFDEALKLQKKLGESNMDISLQKIQENIQGLYSLKHNGKKIKELYECQNTSRSKEHEHTEYVHKDISRPLNTNKFDKKNDGKGSDKQKNPAQQKKQFNRANARERSQPRNVRSENRHRERSHSPPPPYYDQTRRFTPPSPHFSTQSPSGYHPPPPPQGAIHSRGPNPPSTPSGAYPPPGPDPYHYAARPDTRGPSEGSATTYEFKIQLANPSESVRPRKSHSHNPPRETYRNYDYSHAHHHSAYPEGGYAYPLGGYPPPPSVYPPPSNAYPPPSNAYPPPPNAYPSPSGGHSHYDRAYYGYYSRGSSRQDRALDAYAGNRRGRARGHDGRSRGSGAQKFKKGFHKKRNDGNGNKRSDSDEESDSSSASSKH